MSPRNGSLKTSNWTRVMHSKTGVNTRRYNKEVKRVKLNEACFVSVPRLRREDGSFKLPVSV